MFPSGLEESMPTWLRIAGGLLICGVFIYFMINRLIDLHNTNDKAAKK